MIWKDGGRLVTNCPPFIFFHVSKFNVKLMFFTLYCTGCIPFSLKSFKKEIFKEKTYFPILLFRKQESLDNIKTLRRMDIVYLHSWIASNIFWWTIPLLLILKETFLQGVPINMGINWRLLYCLCSTRDYFLNTILQHHS